MSLTVATGKQIASLPRAFHEAMREARDLGMEIVWQADENGNVTGGEVIDHNASLFFTFILLSSDDAFGLELTEPLIEMVPTTDWMSYVQPE